MKTNIPPEPLIRIVDDDEHALDGLRFMLRCEGHDVKTYASAMAFLRDDMPSRTGCLILDVRMPEMSGIELFHELLRRRYRQPIIFLTGHGDIEMAVEAMRQGAADFLVKPVDAEKLVESVNRALMNRANDEEGLTDIELLRDRWETLTGREQEVLRCVARGWMNKTIAANLDISIRTVEAHRAKALHKIGLQTPAQITALLTTLRSDALRNNEGFPGASEQPRS